MHAVGLLKLWSPKAGPIMENHMEKKMENEMETLGPFKGIYRDLTPIMENQMKKKMENEMETGVM